MCFYFKNKCKKEKMSICYDLVYFTTRVLQECNTSNTNATRVRQESHEYDMSAKRTTQVGHEYYMNDTSATRVKNFDFDNDTSEIIFSNLYISYVANKRLQEEKQFHSKNYLLEMPRSHAKMRLKVHRKK